MPQIKAFKGWRYEKNRVGRLADVLAPPYDVISVKEQKKLHKKSPYNVVRLILGKQVPSDSSRNNQYTRARDFLCRWISEGILIQDHSPAIYVYVQDYKEAGRLKTRLGFFAAMKIEEGTVLKHENTLAKPKKDRLALLKEVRTNLSPIFGLFEDRQARIQGVLKGSLRRPPVLDATIDGVRHRLYVEDRRENLNQLSALLAPKPMFIADGHHRFEVACQFRDWMNSKACCARDAGWNYVMTYFSDCVNNPFKIFPTHRLVRLPKSVKDPVSVLAKRGELRKARNLKAVLARLDRPRAATSEKGYSFGVYLQKHGFFILTLDPKLASRIQKNPVDALDVAVLHQMLIEPCFKIKSIAKSSAIDFTRDPREAKARVDRGDFDLALFLRPTSLDEMLRVSKKGLKMPQKSTYFYPKLLSGLVFHRLDDSSGACCT